MRFDFVFLFDPLSFGWAMTLGVSENSSLRIGSAAKHNSELMEMGSS